MDFTPHTDADISSMLATLGLSEPEQLFSHIRADALLDRRLNLPGGLAESDLAGWVAQTGSRNRTGLACFAGGGFYDHYLPPVVRSLTMRPEFVTSYTPYQPEVSQGVLQALYEFQSMICDLTGMEVANASLYDGSSAVLEAVNLAVGATGRRTIWVSRGVSPRTREVLRTFALARRLDIVEHPLVGGRTAWVDEGAEPAAVVMAQPNYLGVIESYQEMVELAHRKDALAMVSADPIMLGMLRSPGSVGCDVVFGEGQPLGNPLSFGGPVFGFFATTNTHVRRLPGRLVGKTKDGAGRTAYVLTLRAREQDIRREKASSNICTNQTLNALAAAVYLAWAGPDGIAEIADRSVQKAHYLARRLDQIPGVGLANDGPFGREFAMLLPIEPGDAVAAMADRGYLAGIPLSVDYPELPGGLLVAVTEQRAKAQLDGYAAALAEVVAR
ncbi:MAG TPA: aminomethyl-transferring glycine dehydrogenase subunit GcvPA [Acidimicrobiia bacterium]|nr:aminomethyl-transferring glycine dehydrogenase subunit GcvPA [Acidimicrobiia bacterium]